MTEEVSDSTSGVPLDATPEQSVQSESAPTTPVETPNTDATSSPPVSETTPEVLVADTQMPSGAPPSESWITQMTYGMLRDLAARGRAGVQKRKRAKFEKILKFLDTHGKVTTHEVAHLLYVSTDTATRYLSQLEKEGKLKQVGKTGHAVYYVKV